MGNSPQLTENVTWSPLGPAPEPSPWESHTIVVVAIFCCVCLLHLSTFLYTICFPFQAHSRPASHLATSSAYEENEIATFQPSSSTTEAPARAGAKGSSKSSISNPTSQAARQLAASTTASISQESSANFN